ncbi:HD-GYP domain-containing protein [Brevibacillus sp. SYSU BS000544]|uniref:HD-GYP domain-containing protein n=1 Tax=Brevibacillus sp. SYSU BS000544 TaxID=3416443 RepID=UPI003CE49F78
MKNTDPKNAIDELQERVDQLKTLLKASIDFNSGEELNEVVLSVLNQMIEITQAEAGTLWLLEESDEIIPAVANGPSAEKVKQLRLKRGEGVVGRVIENNQPELVADVTRDPNWAQRVDEKSGFVTRSLLTIPLYAKGIPIGALQLVNKRENQLFTKEDEELALALASQSALAIHNSKMLDQLYRLSMSFIRTMTLTLDARDPYTAGHSSRVSKYSLLISRKMGLPEKTCRELERAALLHDIGKIGIRDDILLKQAPLTNEEFEIMKTHTEIGARLLSMMEPKSQMKMAIDVARWHHEKLDGTGYPDRLEGDQIPLLARIVAVADAFDAMTTDRPYRKGHSFQVALEEVLRCKGTHFDSTAADAFAEVLYERNFEL